MATEAAPQVTVIHVDAESGFSGGEVQVFHLLRGLCARGWRQVLVAPPGSLALERARAEVGGRLVGLELCEVAMRNNVDVGAVWRLRRLLRRELAAGPCILQLHTGRATWLGAWAAAGLGLVVVSTRRMDRRVKRGLGTRLLYRRLVDRVVAISGAVAEQLESGGVEPRRVRVIHSSVDPADVACSDPLQVRAALRVELGLEPGAFVLLVLARLDRRKGIDVLLRAFERLRAQSGLAALRARNALAARSARRGEGPNNSGGAGAATPIPELLIAGEGPERVALEALAAKCGLAGHVHFLGPRTDKAELLAAADALVLPSRREGLGIAALEALAAGLPVIASRTGGLGEAVVDGECGLLVEPEDLHALAAAIARLAAEPELVARLGAGGPRRIAECYHVDAMVRDYAQLYSELLDGALGSG